MAATPAMSVSIPLAVTNPSDVARTHEGIHSGVPLPEGALRSLDELELIDEKGQPLPAQYECLSQWPDGSLRWVLVNVTQTVSAGQTRQYTLRSPKQAPPAKVDSPVLVSDHEDVFTVDTGRVKFDIPIYSSSLLANIQRKDASGQWISVSKKGLEAIVWRPGVKPFKSRIENCIVESSGPIRSVIRIEGHHLLFDPGADAHDPSELSTFQFILRVFCYAGSGEIRFQYTFINDNRDQRVRPSERYHVYAMEELRDYAWVNGRWVERPRGLRFREQELLDDDYGQIHVKSIKLRLTLDDDYTRYRFGVVDGESVSGEIDGSVALQQVGPVFADDAFYEEMPYPHVPFKASVLHGKDQPLHEFDKAEGWVTMAGEHGALAVGSRFFWQYHPKIYALNANQLEFHVWSRLEDIPDPEIGFAKTHEVALRFGAAEAELDEAGMMAGLNRPLRALTTPQHYVGTGVFGTVAPANHERWGDVETFMLDTVRDVERQRAEQNLYGVRNYGDRAGVRMGSPVYWNQEYDIMLGAMVQFARTGRPEYLSETDVLAWHFMDVDVLHASNSALDEQGQHMHFTDHAKGETHAGHGTVEGLWHYHMLTGEPRAREVAEGIGNFFAKIAAWKDFLDFRDDEERTLGWALKALVSSYRATGNPRYRLAAQMVVEQALAGQDPDTGNWDHPLYPNEDAHRPTCIGGKPWMVGIVLQGMKEYHRAFADERVRAMILKAADWIIWSSYVYMTADGQKPGKGGAHHLQGLSYAWELSGQRYYLDEALTIFSHLTRSWSPEKAIGGRVIGSGVEAMTNMMRIIDEQDGQVWRDGEPVVAPASSEVVAQMRADPKFKAKPQRRY